MQFQKKDIACLRQLTSQVLNQEQTLTLRLDDSLPKLGRVIGAWGQALLRGKEWRNGSVVITGGVIAWVLYVPEDGSACQSVEGWLPFQWKVDIPPTQYDGTVIANLLLRSIDARVLADQKLMLRDNVGLQLKVWVPDQTQIYEPEEVPEDLQILQKSCRIRIPAEAGEKSFAVEEILEYPANASQPEKLLFYRLQPELIEQKMMADKVVFRGILILHTVYLGRDGRLHTWDFEVPYAQFGELEGQYSEEASAGIRIAVTAVDVKETEKGLQLTGSMTGQYVIYEKPDIQLVTDAYSTKRQTDLQMETVSLPSVCAIQTQSIPCQMQLQTQARSVVDTQFMPEHPCSARNEDGPFVELGGQFRMLWENEEGQPELTIGDWNHRVQRPECASMEAAVTVTGIEQATLDGTVQADLLLNTVDFEDGYLDAVSAVEFGQELDTQERPSLILRRADGADLWSIAKETGSTVAAILAANGLEGEPEPNRMLIIPM